MRRQKAKEIDKSKEKQKRNALVQSIAIEQKVINSLDLEKEKLSKQIELLRLEVVDQENSTNDVREKTKKFKEEMIIALDNAKNAQAKVIEYEKRIDDLKFTIETLQTTIVEMRNSYIKERETLVKINNNEKEDHARHINNLRSQIVSMENRVSTLSSLENDIVKSIEDKKLEQVGIEHSLQFRLQELSRINMTVDSTKSEYEKAREEYELWGRRLESIKNQFNKVDKEVIEKTNEVKNKEEEVEKMREQLVALMAREKKIDERAEIIRDLFERAGLNVKL